MALIKIRNLSQSHDGRDILKDINLEINRAETFALIGPTGAGKTTLIRILDLLEVSTSGNIFFDGVDITYNRHERLKARRRISLVQQKPVVFNMSVYDNIACGLKWRHEKASIIAQKVRNVLELVGMSEYGNRNARTLSGGETQRVAIARALVTGPEVLLLDEPTANLDPVSTSKVEEVLGRIISEQKIAVIMATHDMPQGQRLAGTIGVLLNGQIVQIGNPNEVFYSPKNMGVARFVGIENILAGEVIHKATDLLTINVNGAQIQAIGSYNLGEKVHVLVRPENITFSLSREKSSARNVLHGKITGLMQSGSLVRIGIDCGFPLLGLITRSSAQEMELTIGKEINASFKATAIHVIKRWK